MNDLLNRAIRLLSQRDHSETELRRKLAAQPFIAKAQCGGRMSHASTPVLKAPLNLPSSSRLSPTAISITGWMTNILPLAISVAAVVKDTVYNASMLNWRRRAWIKNWCKRRWRIVILTGANRRNKWRRGNLAMCCRQTGKKKPNCSFIYAIVASSRKKFRQFTVILHNECTRGFTSL